MVVTPQVVFPPRKRRPSAGAFLSPKSSSDMELLNSLLHLSREISSVRPFQHLLRRNALSMIRKVNLLSILFEELLRHSSPPLFFSHSTMLCFEEMYILLQRIKTLIEDLSNGSKMWLLMQAHTMSNMFYELTVDLSTLLDIFPLEELKLPEDVQELVGLIKSQCSQANAFFDPRDASLRNDVVVILERIKKEIVPDHDKLGEVFSQLGLRDSSSCREEMESLEEEVQNQNQSTQDKSNTELIIALMGLVRYAKCVLYGGSTPSPDSRWRKSASASNLAVPADFRCPITLDLMKDPVVVATGQTYDREAITVWIQSGHETCPKTGQKLTHSDFIPNRALKNLISSWCRENKIPFETTGIESKLHAVLTNNKAALEATKMTVSFLLQRLKEASPSLESASGAVYELRVLAKTDSDSRARIAEAGAIPLLVRYLGSDVGSEDPSLQVDAVTAILNLSILEANKTKIMETDGAVNGVVEVLRSGATWEAKGNAAATIFSLSGVHSYMKRLGRKTRVVKGLMELAQSGPYNTKRDALAAILNLAGDRETVGKMVEAGVVDVVCGVVSDGLVEEGVTVLEAVVKRGGMTAVAAAFSVIRRLSMVLREGSDRARESAAATLVMICRKGGSEAAAELAASSGIERVIWELMGTGTNRGKRKAASLLRILRRWAAGLDSDLQEGYTATAATVDATTTAPTLPSTSTENTRRIMVPL